LEQRFYCCSSSWSHHEAFNNKQNTYTTWQVQDGHQFKRNSLLDVDQRHTHALDFHGCGVVNKHKIKGEVILQSSKYCLLTQVFSPTLTVTLDGTLMYVHTSSDPLLIITSFSSVVTSWILRWASSEKRFRTSVFTELWSISQKVVSLRLIVSVISKLLIG